MPRKTDDTAKTRPRRAGTQASPPRALARLQRLLAVELDILERSQPGADEQDMGKRTRWVEAAKKLADMLDDLDRRARSGAEENGDPRDRDALLAALERRLSQYADAGEPARVHRQSDGS